MEGGRILCGGCAAAVRGARRRRRRRGGCRSGGRRLGRSIRLASVSIGLLLRRPPLQLLPRSADENSRRSTDSTSSGSSALPPLLRRPASSVLEVAQGLRSPVVKAYGLAPRRERERAAASITATATSTSSSSTPPSSVFARVAPLPLEHRPRILPISPSNRVPRTPSRTAPRGASGLLLRAPPLLKPIRRLAIVVIRVIRVAVACKAPSTISSTAVPLAAPAATSTTSTSWRLAPVLIVPIASSAVPLPSSAVPLPTITLAVPIAAAAPLLAKILKPRVARAKVRLA